MTELRIDIEHLVLRGVPESYGDELGPMVEQRLRAMAERRTLEPGASGPAMAADQVANEVWGSVQPLMSGSGGEVS
jgi:hypothetical protein